MTRDEAITTINELYPADSKFDDTAAIGQELLDKAQQMYANWRNEPDKVLFEYARLCIATEKKSLNKIFPGGRDGSKR